MISLKIHKNSGNFYSDKSYGNTFLSKSMPVTETEFSNDISFIKFHCFDDLDWMDAIMTTRLGGVSKGHLSSLNLGDDRGDLPENVYTNYIHIANSLNLPIHSFVKTDQVHDTLVQEVTSSQLPAGPKIRQFPKTDGVYTKLLEVPLCVGAADCVPVYIVCTDIKAVCVVHSGWKGTVGRIGEKAVEKMTAMGARPEYMIGLIGPSICVDNYEVTHNVYDAFCSEFSKEQMSDIAYKTDDIHYQLDLWAACWHYLHDAGLKSDNIHISGVCTYENSELLWSHRYTKGLRGNQNAIIWKK